MAEAFARRYGKGAVDVYSAGSRPAGKINAGAVAVMAESGIDISASVPKGFDGLPVREFDYVVSMGCRDTCPFVPGLEHYDWQIEDPAGEDIDRFRAVRDRIEKKVKKFVLQITGKQEAVEEKDDEKTF